MSIERIVATSEEAFLKRSIEKSVSCIRQFQRTSRGSFLLGFAAPRSQRKRSRCLDVLKGIADAPDVDWARVVVIAMDEAYGVKPSSEESSAWLLREGLVKRLEGRGVSFDESRLLIPASQGDTQERCAAEYEQQVRAMLQRERRQGPNLVMLHLDQDLSVAGLAPSWYNHSPKNWAQARGKHISALCVNGDDFKRICLNLRTIRQADSVMLLLDQTDDAALAQIVNGLDPETTSLRLRDCIKAALPSTASLQKLAAENEMHESELPPRGKSTPMSKIGSAPTEHAFSPHARRLLHHKSSFSENEVGPQSPLEYVLKYCMVCTVQFRKSDTEHLTFVVCGAAGDLAKKKTIPSLFHLHLDRVLPSNVHIIGVDNPGYNTDVLTTEDLWEKRLRPYLEKEGATKQDLECFKQIVEFHPMDYANIETVKSLDKRIWNMCQRGSFKDNRVFYLALPPFLFADAVEKISQECSSKTGYQRYVVEKPFGKDLKSARELTDGIAKHLQESQIYRIDHYLAKTMAMNILTMRFSNRELGRLFHADNVANVRITFKEDIDCAGRAGYFDGYGIIRDIMQNHLLQLLTLVAMEAPASLKPEDVRDEKVKVLKQIRPIQVSDCVVGQYEGYQEDEQIQAINAKKGYASKCPTFAVAVMYLDNERWSGVPFIMKAGKSLEQRSTIIRLQFKSAPANSLFGPQPQNELIMRVQPDEAIYYKILAKSPGLNSQAKDVRRTVLDMDLKQGLEVARFPEAYEKLIFDVIQGESHNFVRRDEVEEGWRIFDPLLKELEGPEGPIPETYTKGSRGPQSHHALIDRAGFRRYTMAGFSSGHAGEES